MKNKELKELSEKELELKIKDTRSELIGLRVRKQTGQVEKPHLLRTLKRNIARMETYLNQGKLAQASKE